MNNLKDLALECKQYKELIPRLYDDLAAVKKAHKDAVEFNYDLAEENTTIHTKTIAMQERIAAQSETIDDMTTSMAELQADRMEDKKRIAALEAQIKTPATITLPKAEDCAGRSFVITNTGDRTIKVELAKEPSPTRAQLLAVAEAAQRLCAVSDHPVLLHIREALHAAGYLKGEGE